MDKKNSKKAKKKNNKFANRVLLYTGFFLAALLIVSGIVLVANIASLKIFSRVFIGLGIGYVLLVGGFIAFMQRWKIPGIIFKVISLLLTIVMITASVYINITRKALTGISGTDTQIDKIALYVRADDPANDVTDMSDYRFAIIKDHSIEAISIALDKLGEAFGKTIEPAEYNDAATMFEALSNDEVDALLVNESYIALLEGIEGFEELSAIIRVVWTEDIEIQVPTKDNDNPSGEENPSGEQNPTDPVVQPADNKIFTIYVSGIDVYGSPNETRNSDVNIILTVNMNTHEVVMINTPRDFYVQIPVYDYNYDKLTHAGTKGVQASIDTLENLYGINIDYYVRLNFTGFTKIIDALGGITVYSAYEFDTIDGKHFSKGYIDLNGADALSFARERKHLPSGDRARGINQMAVINAMISKLSKPEALANYTSILNAITDCMVTSMSYDKIAEIVRMQLNDMQPFYVVNYAVDGTGANLKSYALGFNTYMMVPNQDTVNQAKKYFNAILNNEVLKK